MTALAMRATSKPTKKQDLPPGDRGEASAAARWSPESGSCCERNDAAQNIEAGSAAELYEKL